MRPFTTDAVIVEGNRIILIRRDKEPFRGMWALPGGFAEAGETAEECCAREAREETGLDVRVGRLVGVFSGPERDPRGTIAGAYLCRVVGSAGRKLKGGDDAAEARWFSLDVLPDLAFDHKKIIEEAKGLIR